MLPLLAITLVPVAARIPVTVVSVLAALVATGAASAAAGRAPRGPAVLRNVIGGAIAMGVTYAIGMLIGAEAGTATTGSTTTASRAPGTYIPNGSSYGQETGS